MDGLTLTDWPPQPKALLEMLQGAVGEDVPTVLPWAELAAEELLTNIFRHAYPKGCPKAELDCRRVTLEGKECLCLRVTDWGTPFDPFNDAPVPDVSLDCASRPVGGLGVHLVRSIVWRHHYSREGHTNVVELFFILPEKH